MSKSILSSNIIVVLASAPGRLDEFDRFLSRRGWIVRLHSDLKNFLADISTIKPLYALISADFQHPNLTATRRLLGQVFRTQIIDFAEEQTAQSWEGLKQATGVFQIYGPLSGPSFERALVHLTSKFQNRDVTSTEKDSRNRVRNGVVQILQKNFRFAEGIMDRPVGWSSKVLCVHLKATHFDGHFLIATGGDEELEGEGQAQLESAMKNMLTEIFGSLEVYDVHPLDIQRVEFKDWALETADFLESGLHDGLEIAVAFFTGSGKIFELEVLGSSDYCKLRLEEVHPGVSLDFDVYLHLPLNGRFLMYIPRGGNITVPQQMNLEGRGIKNLFVAKKDRRSVLRSRVRMHFAQSISNFYESRAA